MKRVGVLFFFAPFVIIFTSICLLFIAVMHYNLRGERNTAEVITGYVGDVYEISTSETGGAMYRVEINDVEGNYVEAFNIMPSIAMGVSDSARIKAAYVKYEGQQITATATGFSSLKFWPGYYRTIYMPELVGN